MHEDLVEIILELVDASQLEDYFWQWTGRLTSVIKQNVKTFSYRMALPLLCRTLISTLHLAR